MRRQSAATIDVQLAAVIAGNVFLDALGLSELIPEFDANLLANNPHILHAESTRNGLAIVEIRGDAVDVDFVRCSDVTSPTAGSSDVVSFRTPAGSRRVLTRS